MSNKEKVIETVEVGGVFVPKEEQIVEPIKEPVKNKTYRQQKPIYKQQINITPIKPNKSQIDEFLDGFKFGVGIINTVAKLLK